MEIFELIRTARALQGISQKEVADQLGLSPTAINRFEKETSTLSQSKILSYAKYININPEFLNIQRGNPFISRDILKFYLPNRAGFTDFSPIDFLIDFNSMLQVLLLIEEKGALGKLTVNQYSKETPVNAIAVKDSRNL